jgi:hypothetical protein
MNYINGGYGWSGPIDWLFKDKCGNKDPHYNERNNERNKYFWEGDNIALKIIMVCLIIVLFGLLIMPLVNKFEGGKNSGMTLGFFIPAIILTFFLICALFMKCKSTRRFWIVILGFGSTICLLVSLFINDSTYEFTLDQLINTIVHYVLYILLLVGAWILI